MEYLDRIDRQLSRMPLLNLSESDTRFVYHLTLNQAVSTARRTNGMLPEKRVLYFVLPDSDVYLDLLTRLDEMWFTLAQLPLLGYAQDGSYDPKLAEVMWNITDPEERADFLLYRHPEILVDLDAAYLNRQKDDSLALIPAFVLRNFELLSEEDRAKRLNWFFNDGRFRRSILIITSDIVSIPPAYQNAVALFEVGMPVKNDILEMILESMGMAPDDLPADDLPKLEDAATYLLGLTVSQIRSILDCFHRQTGRRFYTQISSKHDQQQARDLFIDLVREEKLNMSRMDPMLEYDFFGSMDGISCSETYQQWLEDNERAFRDPRFANSRGVERICGVMMAGLQGTGKTLMAKYTAWKLGIAMITFHLEDLQSMWVGESEKQVKRYLNKISAKAPCLMLIDEAEKWLSVTETTHDSTVKITGELLSWMQNNDSVLCYFTSNDVSSLKDEMLRKGRISEHYFCFLPSAAELADILLEKLRALSERSLREADGGYFKPLYNQEFRDFLADEQEAPGEMLALINQIKPAQDTLEGWRKWPLLFTGADMNAFVKAVNLKLMKQYGDRQQYSQKEFCKAFLELAVTYNPTGVTNMSTIIKTWLLMKDKGYRSISSSPVIPYDKLDARGVFAAKDSWIPSAEAEHYNHYLMQVVCSEIEKFLAAKPK